MDATDITKWTEIGAAPAGSGVDLHAIFAAADHPPFEPARWNKGSPDSNCMAYALDAFGVASLQPGRVSPLYLCPSEQLKAEFNAASGALMGTDDLPAFKEAVRLGLEVDGLTPAPADALYKPGHYLVSLHFLNAATGLGGPDFHFTRLDANGRWSMANLRRKGVDFLDLAGETIANPAHAFLGHDMEFDGFYHVPAGGVNTLRAARAAL